GDTPSEPTHFQRLDLASVAAAAGAGYERVYGPSSLVRDVNRAFRRAVVERRPVMLNLPPDSLSPAAGAQDGGTFPLTPEPLRPGEARLDAALGLIASAERPVILAGWGAVRSGAGEALVELADLLAAPLSATVLAKDLFHGHPANLGICGNLSHS